MRDKGKAAASAESPRLSTGSGVTPGRRLRADAQRNRESLTDAAKAVFAEAGANASLDDIAKRAGVGIGTLYRNFPNRDAIIEAVYRREVQHLTEAADRLGKTLIPGDALHQWMQLFVDYVAAKKVLTAAFSFTDAGAPERHASSGERITEAVTLLAERAMASGEIRPDLVPGDILQALIGFTYGGARSDWESSARRLVDVLMNGLRTCDGRS